MASKFQFGSRQNSESEIVSPTRRDAVRRETNFNGGAAGYSSRDVGAALRERRDAMGVSLAEAEAATRIRQKYLAALEADEWHLLPGEVVGRGFLRNYSGYLGLEPTEIIDRRRTVADESLSTVLANTSAGSMLPPIRQVDYRPKEVDLKDEPDGMETREIRLGPIFGVLGALALVALLWWARGPIGNLFTAATDSVASLFEPSAQPIVTPDATALAAAAVINPDNAALTTGAEPVDDVAGAAGDGANGSGETGDAGTSVQSGGTDPLVAILVPTSTPTATPVVAEPPPTPTAIPLPTDTPVVDELPPLPTPTDAPVLLPTPTPETNVAADVAPADAVVDEVPLDEAAVDDAQAQVVVPAACADPNSSITSPGVGQTLTGVVAVTGTANNGAFQYYKLEYAPGANADGGYVYFAGANAPVVGGVLGNIDTTALPNGDYTLQIVVVDQTGNFPPPCRVPVIIQN